MARDLPQLVGQSQPFLEVLEQVSRLAPVDRPVLVAGERGTGKELIAARLHFLSPRWNGPFVKVNCAALTASLIETELFGHEAGAFTGAAKRRIGRFEQADGGTLFLDEIATASLAVQEKILRVIEYGEMERVGGSATLRVDVRLVGATNVDLPAAAEAGTFRHDLLDRLAFDVVTLPPLRARRGDVPLLAEHFARAMAHELEWSGFPGFTAEAQARLESYAWPGNVRELRNVAERAVAAAPAPGPGPIRPIGTLIFDPFDSPYRPRPTQGTTAAPPDQAPVSASASDGGAPSDLRAAVAAFEKRLLEQALDANRHNQRATARHLGLSYHQLRNSLKKHALLGDPPRPSAPNASVSEAPAPGDRPRPDR